LIHFVPLNSSLPLHVTYIPYYCPYTINTTETSMPPVGFEPAVPASARPQTYALDRAATGIGNKLNLAPFRFRPPSTFKIKLETSTFAHIHCDRLLVKERQKQSPKWADGQSCCQPLYF
jgi:hypothetical protein